MLCPCSQDALCEPCRRQRFAQLRGVAASRGERWAERVARTEPRTRTWPPHDADAELARRLAGDLTRDPQLLEMLAAELAARAAKRWAELRR